MTSLTTNSTDMTEIARISFLATFFVLQPLQRLWENAKQVGSLQELVSPGGAAHLAKALAVRMVFLHGAGGSGKTFCMTEVVIKVVRGFLGERGVKAVAATNSTARLLRGKTIHAAAKMTIKQSLQAKKLKPTSGLQKALELEWNDSFMMLGDEIGVSAPALLAGLSRRAFYARRRMLNFKLESVMEHPFGDVRLQVYMADFLQLMPVRSHSLVEAFCKSPIQGNRNNNS